MKRSESIEIDAPRDAVWSIAADRFDQIGQWSSGVFSSQPLHQDDASPGRPLGFDGRRCDTPQGETFEAFVDYDPEAFSFTYEVSGGPMPGFVQRATNTWTVEVVSAGRTRLTMTVEMATRGFLGVVMQPMMGFGMGKVLRTNLEDLKHFIEHGAPSPRKANMRPKPA